MHFNRTISAQQQSISNRVANSDPYTFFNLLTGPELLDQVESLLPPASRKTVPTDGDVVDVFGASSE